MAPISNNFNVLSVAGNQSLIPAVLPSVSWFRTTFIIWMWLATSDDADEAEDQLEKRRQQVQAQARREAKGKRQISGRIEEQPKAPPARRFAPAFR